MVEIIVSVLIISYVLLILIFWLGWEKAQPCAEEHEEGVSVLIAVRNEEASIGQLLKGLAAQDYPQELLEVVIIDDHSTDNTPTILREFQQHSSLHLKIETLTDKAGKKAAISTGVALCTHEIILTTDGDCRVPADWVAGMVRCFANPGQKLVSGPVRMYPQNSFFQRLQAIEFSSLISSGAATMMLGWPTMANAANMAFRKDIYASANKAGAQTASGDDVFLLHAVARNTPRGYTFCRDEAVLVDTASAPDLSTFFRQRQRWSGKWQHYTNWPTKLLAVFIFLTNLATVCLPAFVLFAGMSWVVAANLLAVKLLFEFWFLREVQKFMKSKFLLHEFIILAIIYPLYVTITALAGLPGKKRWKGRTTT